MNIQEIQKRVALIAESGDPEQQHTMEDALVWDFVQHVASKNNRLAKKAKAVLKSQEIKFPRWAA